MILFAAQAAGPPALLNMLPLILMFGVFYFLLIRPQQKKQKEHQNFIANLAKNTEVVTSGGLNGTIVNVKETTVVLRIAEGVKVEIEKHAITHAKNGKTK